MGCPTDSWTLPSRSPDRRHTPLGPRDPVMSPTPPSIVRGMSECHGAPTAVPVPRLGNHVLPRVRVNQAPPWTSDHVR